MTGRRVGADVLIGDTVRGPPGLAAYGMTKVPVSEAPGAASNVIT
jgi:hypothetical protein